MNLKTKEMNCNGKQIVDAIVRRLNDEDVRCYDSAIVAKLASLNRYELNQLITFGETDKWLSDRNNKAKDNLQLPTPDKPKEKVCGNCGTDRMYHNNGLGYYKCFDCGYVFDLPSTPDPDKPEPDDTTIDCGYDFEFEEEPAPSHCACSERQKHGETSVMCCNECGKPTEKFWSRG